MFDAPISAFWRCLVKVLFWGALASGPLALGLWWLAGLSPATVEWGYSRGFYPFVMAPWSRLVGMVPFALAPVLVGALVVGAVSLFFLMPPMRALSVIVAGVSVLVAWFVVGWGLNYQRLSWAANHQLVASGGTVSELETLASRLAPTAGFWRDKAQVPDREWASQALGSAVSRAFERAGRADPLLAGRYGNPKPVPFPEALSWLGIAGICIPHTGEPLVNTGPADWQLPFTEAHEAAHLRGWAREDEANFLAFWVLKDDPDPALAYSAWGSALLYVASALEAAGPEGREAWARVLSTLNPGIRDDWKTSFAYWERFKGPARGVAQTVNDWYLKSQGQVDGVKSYGRMVDLLLTLNLPPGETDFGPEPH